MVENKEVEKVPRKKVNAERRIEKDLLKIFIFLGVLVVIYLIASSAFKSFSQFEYEDLRFTKERFGDIVVYHHYYHFNSPITGDLIRYNLFLKNDPRENDVLVETTEIKFPEGRAVYIAVDSSELRGCYESAVAVATLSGFLTDNQFEVKGGTNDFIESNLYGHEYFNCDEEDFNPIVNVEGGEETKISGGGICYTITIGPECDIVKAVEKFQIKAVLDAKARREAGDPSALFSS